jgi:hypothetical protein
MALVAPWPVLRVKLVILSGIETSVSMNALTDLEPSPAKFTADTSKK